MLISKTYSEDVSTCIKLKVAKTTDCLFIGVNLNHSLCLSKSKIVYAVSSLTLWIVQCKQQDKVLFTYTARWEESNCRYNTVLCYYLRAIAQRCEVLRLLQCRRSISRIHEISDWLWRKQKRKRGNPLELFEDLHLRQKIRSGALT